MRIRGSRFWTKLDPWLPRVSHLSQFGLLALAAFGYFHTVLPLYKTSLLEEQIAEKEIRLKSITADAAQLETKNVEAAAKLAAAAANLTEVQTKLQQREVLIEQQGAQLADTERRMRGAAESLAKTTQDLRNRSRELFTAQNKTAQTYEQLRSAAMNNVGFLVTTCEAMVMLGSTTEDGSTRPELVDNVARCIEVSTESGDWMLNLTSEDRAAITAESKRLARRMQGSLGPEIADAIERDRSSFSKINTLAAQIGEKRQRQIESFIADIKPSVSKERMDEIDKRVEDQNREISALVEEMRNVYPTLIESTKATRGRINDEIAVARTKLIHFFDKESK